ncbi:CobW family GTP-binding protein [Pseudomonas entomophila]|uniref:CobW family GTP-binding protein n=1 Tax=Pseudomonas entomophila TaxID=312306 RepID=UPI0023D8A970|nr:CobW family GTP-binding protein [Pseudomonas entomophila]MDF0733414.1 CobW family GTP-binding protein [Pseudomonas entomophila]
MLHNLPTHVIAGPLGAGKTSLIRHLLAQRPADESWAVLVNEFGQIGLDAALLSRDETGITLGEVAGGCLCCVNGAPFQVGLGRLLRKARPDRLFIEPSGLGHPLQLLKQLGEAPWAGVLAVQPLLMVLDGPALARGEPLPEAQQQALVQAGLLIGNKSAAVDQQARLLITSRFVGIPLVWTDYGHLSLSRLPILSTDCTLQAASIDLPVDSSPAARPTLWTTPDQPICLAQQGEGGWSIGWRWHPSQRFEAAQLRVFLGQWPWRRAKGVIHSDEGWLSFNGLAGNAPEWRASEWRKDSRIELIFDQPQPEQALQHALARCRLGV